jgi:hypothetical protein
MFDCRQIKLSGPRNRAAPPAAGPPTPTGTLRYTVVSPASGKTETHTTDEQPRVATRNSWADNYGSACRPSAPKVARQLAATAASVISDWTSTGWPERADLIAANNKALHCRLSM